MNSTDFTSKLFLVFGFLFLIDLMLPFPSLAGMEFVDFVQDGQGRVEGPRLEK